MTDFGRTNYKTETETSERQQTTTTSTYYYLPHGARRVLNPDELEQIRIAYNGVLGELNSVKARIIEFALTWGLDYTAIIDAIEQTALAPHPTHYYFQAIVNRYMNDRLITAKDAERDRYIRREKQRKEKWERDEWFEHRKDELPY